MDTNEGHPVMLRSLQERINQAVSNKQWADAVDHLIELLSHTKSHSARARTAYTIAVFYRDHLRDPTRAIYYFQQALHEDPTLLRAFDALESLLHDARDWRALERALRTLLQTLHALPDDERDPAVSFGIWFKLGELYASKLSDPDSATSAFEQAKAMRPHSLEAHRALIDLYSRQQRYDDAISTCTSALSLPPDVSVSPTALALRHADFYHALFTFYMHLRQFDSAWCVSSLLSFLRAAEPVEADLYTHYASAGLSSAQGRFTNDLWSLVTHPSPSMRISNIMAVISAACRDLFSYDLSHWGLRKKHKLDLSANALVCKLYPYSAGVIGLAPLPELYLNAEQILGMFNANLTPPAFILGADMLQGHTPQALAFITARQLALATPQHYMASLGLTDEILKGYMIAAIIACSPSPPPVSDPSIQEIVKQLAKMPTPMKMELTKMMRPILDAQLEVNLAEWLRGVDLTANRVALLLCGDISTAIHAVRNDNRPISSLSTADRERDLIAFSTSPNLFEARARLGLSIA
jgi:tetratricopeptide (TPR) repeat protein